MKQPLEVSYNVGEVDALIEAYRLVAKLETESVWCHPAWKKLFHVKEYLQKRQIEVLADVLGDPEGFISPKSAVLQ